MNTVTLYSTGTCPYCVAAENLLKKRGFTDIHKIRVDQSTAEFSNMIERTGRKTVPQIFIDDQHIGGFDDLVKYDSQGKLQ
jgi:glutaredoxin 3